ncbi:MAG: DUF3575 domain-containing protein [Rikenellaceae bacterium]|nr:DUF3575 domain-containing protein [Rikenellaceae bacterium]MCL2693317.1 DUF3575 domain-containing protein [Rikenellaceae bacterium]
MRIKTFLLAIGGAFLLFGNAHNAKAQDFAIKTNLLYWATTTMNLQVEFGLGERTTLELGGNWNPWTFDDNKKIKHWLVQPELRLWNCERFNRGFFGIHLIGGQFNAGGIKLPFDLWPDFENRRFEGWMYGGGISYGYQWYLGPRWNLEATIGAGYMRLDMTEYNSEVCGEELGKKKRDYWGPTKVGLSFVYLF